MQAAYPFYAGTFALEVRHSFGIVRYCEVGEMCVAPGADVRAGHKIAAVGKLSGLAQSMLHLELYSGNTQGPLTDRDRVPFMRRSDLMDPTALLDSLEVANG